MSWRRVFPAKDRPRIFHAPGWGLRRFADDYFSQRTFAEVFAPILDEMQQEYSEALVKGRTSKIRMVLLRGYWKFWSAVAQLLPISIARCIYDIWKTGD